MNQPATGKRARGIDTFGGAGFRTRRFPVFGTIAHQHFQLLESPAHLPIIHTFYVPRVPPMPLVEENSER